MIPIASNDVMAMQSSVFNFQTLFPSLITDAFFAVGIRLILV
ncbi:MAG: hypothetical protein ACR5LD_09135 [Symbiopectobacterium sp.]